MILAGKIFISTVSIHKSIGIRKVFEPLGANVIDFPMTEIVAARQTSAMKSVIRRIEEFQWIIFTSANGVKHFWILMETCHIKKIPSAVKIAAVGSQTALELTNTGSKVDFIGSGTAETLANELIEKESPDNCNILLPLGNLAPDTLRERLTKFACVTRINVYHTLKAPIESTEPVARIKKNNYDLVLFTSPSGVNNFAEVLGPDMMNPELRIASIGKVTSLAAESLGLKCLVTAKRSTYEGLANEIINYYTLKN